MNLLISWNIESVFCLRLTTFSNSVQNYCVYQHITTKAMHVQLKCGVRSCNHCCSGKALIIAYCECVSVALGIKHVMRMRRVILSSLVCPGLRHFYKLSHNLHDFRKKIYWKQNVFFFSITFVQNIIVLRTERHTVSSVYWSSCKVPVIFARFYLANYLVRST